MIEKLQGHYGFTRTPFGRDLAPGMLHRHAAHNEAVARIHWCIAERSIGVVTGEVGAGKTVSVRTVLAGLDTSRHTVVYLGNPMIGVRGIHEAIVTAFGGAPTNLSSRLVTQAASALTAERDERGRTPILALCYAPPWMGTLASQVLGMVGDGTGPAGVAGGARWCPGCRGGARVVVGGLAGCPGESGVVAGSGELPGCGGELVQ